MGWNQQKTAGIPECMLNLWISCQAGRPFQWLCRKSSRPPDATTSTNFPDCCSQPIPNLQVFLPYGLFTYPITFPFLPPFLSLIYSQHKFFQSLHLSSPNSLCKRALSTPGQGTCLYSPSSPAASGLDCMPHDLILFLASIWLEPFLSGQFSALKVLFNIL